MPIRFLNPVACRADPGIGDRLVMEKRRYRVNRGDICFLKYLIESYEGLATVTTEDAAQGCIAVRIAPGCTDTVDAIMNALAPELYFERIE